MNLLEAITVIGEELFGKEMFLKILKEKKYKEPQLPLEKGEIVLNINLSEECKAIWAMLPDYDFAEKNFLEEKYAFACNLFQKLIWGLIRLRHNIFVPNIGLRQGWKVVRTPPDPKQLLPVFLEEVPQELANQIGRAMQAMKGGKKEGGEILS
jgi:hypothetical protein